jgi:hypothetical protein
MLGVVEQGNTGSNLPSSNTDRSRSFDKSDLSAIRRDACHSTKTHLASLAAQMARVG